MACSFEAAPGSLRNSMPRTGDEAQRPDDMVTLEDSAEKMSRRVVDMSTADFEDPKKFALAVDSENKAKELKILSIARPHMLCFHLNW